MARHRRLQAAAVPPRRPVVGAATGGLRDQPQQWCPVATQAGPQRGRELVDRLEAALNPLLDVDETLKFLALDVALVNSDGGACASSKQYR